MAVPSLTSLAAALLEVPAPERALVVGCGDGDAVLLLAREFPAARVRGLDPSPALAREATRRVGLDPEGRVAFKAGKPGALPYPDAFFDLVVQLGGRPSPAEIARVLRSGGHLILTPQSGPWLGRGGRERFLRRRLARRGFSLRRNGDADGGNFTIGRLGRPG